MRRYLLSVLAVVLTSTAILFFHFGYSGLLMLSHVWMMLTLSLVVAASAYVVYFIFRNKQLGKLLANLIPFLFWLFVLFFYMLVLGSNYFWGNTITFEILQNYLANLSHFLNVLPIEKWILVTAIIVFFVIIIAWYWFIRFKPSDRVIRFQERLKQISLLRIGAAVVIALAALFLLLGPIMEIKRYMHFNQEPFVYFTLGPMWAVHSEALFLTQPAKTQSDVDCINAIGLKEKNGRTAIVILVDALRADHLPMYGYQRNTAPFMDSLFRSGKLSYIPHSFSGSSNTIGGVSSLFFSREWDSLNLTQLNLMQYFKRSGYKTYAYLTGYHSGWYGLSAMYRNNCDYFYESTSEYGKAIDDDLITVAEFESTKPEANSFLYFHLLSVHDIGTRDDRFRKFMPDKIGLTTSGYEPVVNHYDNGVLQADYAISRIFQHLQKNGLLDDATIYIVGDHGNLLGEDGRHGHSGGLHPKLLEVPILIYDAQLNESPARNVASIMDVAPSLTKRFFNDVPDCWQGTSIYDSTADGTYHFNTSASTATKTDLYRGKVELKGDSLTLRIFDKQWNPVKFYQKINQIDWKSINEKGEVVP